MLKQVSLASVCESAFYYLLGFVIISLFTSVTLTWTGMGWGGGRNRVRVLHYYHSAGTLRTLIRRCKVNGG